VAKRARTDPHHGAKNKLKGKDQWQVVIQHCTPSFWANILYVIFADQFSS